jgi:3',5'-cyclic AMP phosphodiesterase CpdA
VTIRLLHLSDVHFGGEYSKPTEAVTALAYDFDPDLVVVTGDLTLNARPREFEAARDWLSRLPKPQLVTPGDQDSPYWNPFLRALAPFDRYCRYIGSIDVATRNLPGLAACGVSTVCGARARFNRSRGAISLATIKVAADRMKGVPNALKVLVCHHPLIKTKDGRVTDGAYRGGAAARMLAEAGVDLILTGHAHRPFATPLPHGEGRTYAMGAGTLSLRTQGTQAGFSTIEADATTIKATALGWTGSRFEPISTWVLPRRF